MKSAGKILWKASPFTSNGQWIWPYGMEPLSNQQSNTSGILWRTPFPIFEGMVRWSIFSLWRSVMFVAPVNVISSSTEPMQTTSSKSSETQSGMGLPQQRLLEKHQSFAFYNQLWKRASYANLGTQYDFLLFTRSFSLRAVTSINQDFTAL